MPEPTAASVPPEPIPVKTRRPRGESNRAFLNELNDAGKVAKAALDTRYAPALAEEEMDTTLPAQIQKMAGDLRKDLARMKGARTGRKTFTQQETKAATALLAALAPIQTAAKRRFADDEETLRENYYIGASLGSAGLFELSTAVGNVLARLVPGPQGEPPADVLPGVKAEGKIKALADALATYGVKDAAQSDEQSTATGLLEKITADIAALAALRRAIQLTADQAWPWRTPRVTSFRRAFLLPTDRPLTD